MNKKVLSVAVATALTAGFTAAPAQAEMEISGNVALTSDYRFRGISQSDEEFAIQGGFDIAFEPGFYIGTWGSSVDFDTNETVDGSLELDYYAGWAGNIGDSDFGIDIGYFYYDYPGDDGNPEGDYQEIAVGLSWGDLGLGLVYSDDYYAETDEFWYVSGDYSFTILEDLSIGLHVGYNMLDEDGGFLSSDEDAYTDYSVSATYTYGGVDFSLAWVGTDLDDDDVFGTDWADDTAVFTISKSM
ncbi:MAG: TorF family putative porin [Halioglobus sp.]